MQLTASKAKPFPKWAGGKAQLIEQIANHLPAELKLGKLHQYVVPFVGGSALSCNSPRVIEIQLEFFNGTDLGFDNNTHPSACA